MFIVRVTSVTDDLIDAIQRLIPQLTLNVPVPTQDDLERLIESDSSILLAARYPEDFAPIVGLLTLIVYRAPTGIRARIEDLVVEQALRGKGVGEVLMRYALNMARDVGADGISLTSNPKREAANRLYQRLGFKPWQTNLYFYKF